MPIACMVLATYNSYLFTHYRFPFFSGNPFSLVHVTWFMSMSSQGEIDSSSTSWSWDPAWPIGA